MAGNEGLPHSKKIHVIKHLTNIKIQSISVSKRTSSHNLQLTNTEKSHRQNAVTFLTQPGESAKLITFHTKNLALLKKA